jgi:hypothetical protein
MYEYINHVLANYLNANIEYSEDEAISVLRKDLKNSTELSDNLKAELEKAFSDKSFSWKNTFSEYDVFFARSEEEASSYARKVLWTPVFKN